MSATVTSKMVAVALKIYHDDERMDATCAMETALRATCSHVRAEARKEALEEAVKAAEAIAGEFQDEMHSGCEGAFHAAAIRALLEKEASDA